MENEKCFDDRTYGRLKYDWINSRKFYAAEKLFVKNLMCLQPVLTGSHLRQHRYVIG